MSERPYEDRPAARPDVNSVPDPSEPTPPAKPLTRGGCCLVIVLWIIGVAAVGAVVVGLGNLSGGKPFFGVTKATMQDSCREIVASGMGVPLDEVSGFDRSEGTAGWDFGGSYPGGEWQCGGPAEDAEPTTVIVFLGGIASEGEVVVLRPAAEG